jgi:hypothetical protein
MLLTNQGSRFLGGGRKVATWQVVTTGAATHTIAAFTVSASTVVDWGDGSTSTYTGAGARTHDYAGAGTWTVRVMQPLNVTALTLADNKVVLNSAGIASMTNMATFVSYAVRSGRFDSVDVAAWRPTAFTLVAMPAGYLGTFNSADVAAWRPTTFSMYSLPAGFAGTFNSADISSWRPEYFVLFAMPDAFTGTFNSSNLSAWNPVQRFNFGSMGASFVGTFATADITAWRPNNFELYAPNAAYTYTITGSSFAAWTTTTTVVLAGLGLAQATDDAILYGMYQASIAPRTVANGTINIGGSNAAPSGTFQACASPPVTAATPGKEIAHELLNDTIGAFANHWATVVTS